MLYHTSNFKLRLIQFNQAMHEFINAPDHTGWKSVLQQAGRKFNQLQAELPYRIRSRYHSIWQHLPTISWPKSNRDLYSSHPWHPLHRGPMHGHGLPDNPGDRLFADLAAVVNYADQTHHKELTLNQFMDQARTAPPISPMGHAWKYLHTLATHIASIPVGHPYGPLLNELDAADWHRELGFSMTPNSRISHPHNTFTLVVLEQAARAESQPVAWQPNNLEIHGPQVHVAITRTMYKDYTIDAITPSEGPDADQFWTNLQDAHAEHPNGVFIHR